MAGGGAHSDLPAEMPAGSPGDPPALRLAYGIGGLGLLGATLADSLAVAGRHTGFHLLGSIEIVQMAVVLLAASAMFAVTVRAGHASVQFVVARSNPKTAARLMRLAALLSALAFLLIASGSAWVLAETWGGFEQTELLHIPLKWLRLVWTVFAFLIAGLFLRTALRHRA